jgi:acetyl esterase/lipase
MIGKGKETMLPKSPFSGFKRIFQAMQLNSMADRIFSSAPPPANARIPYGSDPLQFADLRLPEGDGPHPVAVVIHGGFWRAKYTHEHIGHLCAVITDAGIATWSVEYRRIGNEGGGWPNTMLDVGAATDYLREIAAEYNLDLARVVTMGHSAGGHLALWTASRHRVAEDSDLYMPSPLPVVAAVSLAGVTDLRTAWELRLSNNVVEELMDGTPAGLPERYAAASPIELLPIGVKQVLIHGSADSTVPDSLSKIYADRARELGDDPKYISLKDVGHFDLIDPQSKWSGRVIDEVVDILKRKT